MMEKLTERKFKKLSNVEMQHCLGGRPYNIWKTETQNGVTFEQRYNVWGSHATGDIRNSKCDD